MSEAQLRHQLQLFAVWLVMSIVVGLVCWAIALALGVRLHPLPVFAFAGVVVWMVDGFLYRWWRS